MDSSIYNKLVDFFNSYESKSYAKGDIIVYANQDPDGVLWLQEGIVEQYTILDNGSRVTLNFFRHPAFFPMSWAINKKSNNYFFEAVTDVTLKCADPDVTIEYLLSSPDILLDLLGRVYRGTDGIFKRLELAMSGSASNRLIFELLIEAYRVGEIVDDSTRIIRIRQDTLASRCGLARETVSRMLTKLEGEQLVKRDRIGLVVHVSRLQELAGIELD